MVATALLASGERRGWIGSGRGGLGLGLLPMPGQQLVQFSGRVIIDPAEHVGEPGLRINAVQLGGLCRPPDYAERARFPEDWS
jgi:hypothetical protein